MPQNRFVPYVDAGVDYLVNKFDGAGMFAPSSTEGGNFEVNDTYGGHLSAGIDFFFTPNIAFNAEIRGLYTTEGDLKLKAAGSEMDGMVMAKYNPTNISAFMGLRFFFP